MHPLVQYKDFGSSGVHHATYGGSESPMIIRRSSGVVMDRTPPLLPATDNVELKLPPTENQEHRIPNALTIRAMNRRLSLPWDCISNI